MNGVLKTLLLYNITDNAFKLTCKIPWNHQVEKTFENQVHAYQMPFQFNLQVDD